MAESTQAIQSRYLDRVTSENQRSMLEQPVRARLRVALVCPGVGVEQRGFERLFANLFHALGDRVDAKLFKGGGPVREREIVLRFARRNGWLNRRLPIHRLVGKTALHAECATFALALLPHLRSGRFDVVHCIDPPLAKALVRLRDRLGLRFRLLYTEGTSMPPADYPPCDFLHQIGLVAYTDALAHGVSEHRMALLQPGVHRFTSSDTRADLRRRHSIDEETFLILYVGAINRVQKRVDHLIREVERMSGDFLLWIDGSMDQGDPTILEEAKNRLGKRVRVTRVASDAIGDLYAMADVMVVPSVFEAFGLVIAEALAVGTPVLMHDSAHFRWIAPNDACHVDMREPGLLAERLSDLQARPHARDALRGVENARERFDWEALAPRYVELYERTANVNDEEAWMQADSDSGSGRSKRRGLVSRSKFLALRSVRRAGLLKPADMAYFWLTRARAAPRNRRFVQENPGFATPPAHLAFDALHHVDWREYRDSGLRHAGEFARLISEATEACSLDVLEWGCGPGRLLRHMKSLLPGRDLTLTGSDYNEESIEWCRANLSGITFVRNELAPPLPFEDGRFDVVYCFSVFTHLSEAMQLAWASEAHRVLRPGGVFICTTHGDRCRHLLTTIEEHRQYNCGQVVVQGQYKEGRKWFLAVHPPLFVREKLLRPFAQVSSQRVNAPDLLQEFWLARKAGGG